MPHNKPDLILWDCDEKICCVIEFSCHPDIDIQGKLKRKWQLVVCLQEINN